jgi:hypothetical protein
MAKGRQLATGPQCPIRLCQHGWRGGPADRLVAPGHNVRVAVRLDAGLLLRAQHEKKHVVQMDVHPPPLPQPVMVCPAQIAMLHQDGLRLIALQMRR